MIGNILDNTTELYMIKYTFGEIFNSGGANLYKNPSDQTVDTDIYRPIPKLYRSYPAYHQHFSYFLLQGRTVTSIMQAHLT